MQWIYVGIGTAMYCDFKPNTTTVADVKKQVKQATGIPVQRQELYYYGCKLSNSAKLSAHNIHHRSGLRIALTNKTKPAAKPIPPRAAVSKKANAQTVGKAKKLTPNAQSSTKQRRWAKSSK